MADIPGGVPITDENAIHDNTPSEINALSAVVLADADVFLVEDANAGTVYSKLKCLASAIWTYIGGKITETIPIQIVNTAGNPLVTGAVNLKYKFPCNGTLVGWWVEFNSGVSDTVTLDLWVDAWSASSKPTVADTIIDTGSGGIKPNVGPAANGEAFANLDNWTTTFLSTDALEVNVDAVGGTTTALTLHLTYIRT